MKRTLMLIHLCLFGLIACQNRHVAPKAIDITKNCRSIFVSETVRDSVIAFMNSINSFPEMECFPVEYLLLCEIDRNKDTIIEMHAAIEFTPTGMLLEPERLIGGANINNKPLMVRYKNLMELKEVINEDELDELLGKQIDSLRFIKELDSIGYEGPRTTTYKRFKICDKDSLKLIHSTYLGNKINTHSL